MRSSLSWLAATTLVGFAGSLQAQTLGCELGGAGGIIPASGTGGGGVYPGTLPPFEFISVLNVAATPVGATAVTEVKLNGLSHTWSADVMIVLEDPSGAKHMLLNQQGGSCDFGGDYVIVAPQLTPMPFPACVGTSLPSSTFSQVNNAWPAGTNGINNTSLSAIAPQVGNWTLYMYDWAGGDSGTLTSWDVCFGTPPPPPPPPPAPCNGPSLSTLFLGGNNGSLGGQVFFDMTVLNPAGITLSQLEIASTAAAGINFTTTMYLCPTTYVGNTTNFAAWTLLSSGNGVAAGGLLPCLVEMTDALIPQGSYGVALVNSATATFRYTNGNGTNQNYANGDLTLTLGAALNVPWTGTAFTPRVWNGTVRYNCSTGSTPTIYCTAKTTSSGCVPAIAFSGTPSLAGNYTVSCSQVEANQLGVLFYSLNGPAAIPFQDGFLCMNPPVVRMPVQPSGGAAACSGTYTQGMTSVISTLNIGDTVNCQYWFRDPFVTSGTGLSDANEFVVQ